MNLVLTPRKRRRHEARFIGAIARRRLCSPPLIASERRSIPSAALSENTPTFGLRVALRLSVFGQKRAALSAWLAVAQHLRCISTLPPLAVIRRAFSRVGNSAVVKLKRCFRTALSRSPLFTTKLQLMHVAEFGTDAMAQDWLITHTPHCDDS
jgi:hypothetical protein